MKNHMNTFNPYKDAADDARIKKEALMQYRRGWCRKCNTEKRMAGGKTSGGKITGGVVQKFICAECIEKIERTKTQ